MISHTTEAFCRAIRMPQEAIERIREVEEQECKIKNVREEILRIFHGQKGEKTEFYRVIAGDLSMIPRRSKMERQEIYERFLYYYIVLGEQAGAIFAEKGYDKEIYIDTMKDITLWCEKCFKKHGVYGIYQYDWLWRHVGGSLARLGRLQYEEMESEWEIKYTQNSAHHEGEKKRIMSVIRDTDPVINIHIPEGSPLSPESCRQSIELAKKHFGTEIPMICHSWLLFPGLGDITKPDSNILKFQNLFEVAIVNVDEREGEERVFGLASDDPTTYPEETSLQRAAKKYLCSGRKIGTGIGVLK